MKTIRRLSGKCKNCKFFNEEYADKMFYNYYCDLYDCQLDKLRKHCKYFKPKEE